MTRATPRLCYHSASDKPDQSGLTYILPTCNLIEVSCFVPRELGNGIPRTTPTRECEHDFAEPNFCNGYFHQNETVFPVEIELKEKQSGK